MLIFDQKYMIKRKERIQVIALNEMELNINFIYWYNIYKKGYVKLVKVLYKKDILRRGNWLKLGIWMLIDMFKYMVVRCCVNKWIFFK